MLQAEPLPTDGWASYSAWRPVPSFVEPFFAWATDRLSQPLTALLGLSHFYGAEGLAAKSSLTLHVIGASDFEVVPDQTWVRQWFRVPAPLQRVELCAERCAWVLCCCQLL